VKPVKVGICGLGTVGGGTFNVLQRNAEEIARRAGRGIEVAQIATRTPKPQFQTTGIAITNDVFEVATNPEIDIVIELVGGYTVARELVLKAIENGKHVVTANKALIAVHGNEIFARAREKGVIVAFEAAVAGGIPVIKAIREGLSANRINWVAGIINGTGNFILTEMREKGRAFEDVLVEAQAGGVVLGRQENRHGPDGRWQGNQGRQVRQSGLETVRPRPVDRGQRYTGHRPG